MKYFILVFFSLLCVVPCYSQLKVIPPDSNAIIKGFIEIGLQVGVPQEDFRKNLKSVGFGGGGYFGVRIKDMPIYAGLDISLLTYERVSDTYLLTIDGVSDDYDFDTRARIFSGHILMQVRPDVHFFLHPYADFLVGFKNLFTKTEIKNSYTGDVYDSDLNKGAWALSYGGAVGVEIPINWFLSADLRCAYLRGAAADYLVRKEGENAQNYNTPVEAFEVKNSTTDLLMPQIGIKINIYSNFDDEKGEGN